MTLGNLRGRGVFAPAALTGLLAFASGCGDTITTTALAPSDFPGTSVDANYLAADGLAFSDSDAWSDTGDVQVFRNVSNGDAILTFLAYNNNGNGATRLMASYYNGSTFTAPVEILGSGEDVTSNRGSIRVLFLETSRYSGADGGATSRGRARDGDAILVYTSSDVDDPSSDDRDANTRAYGTYFDRSKAGARDEGGVVNGFQTVSIPLDFDHVVMGGGNDSDVGQVGFVSDSLHGTHQFGGAADSGGVSSGDPTSFVQIAVRKSTATGTANVQARWATIPFDLGQVGNALVPQSGATSGQLNPAVGTLEDGDTVSTALVVNDGIALWGANDVDVNGEDTVLTATVFSAQGSASINLGSAPTGDFDSSALPSAANVYGPDHGVGGYYVFFTETGFTDGNAGSRTTDVDLMLAQIDAAAGTRSLVEIDAYRGPIDETDGDNDGYELRRDTGASAVLSGTRVHADGGLITALFLQASSDVGDLNDASNTVGAPEVNNIPFVQVVQTGRAPADLATSVLAAPVRAPALESTGDVSMAGADQANVTALDFQIGLASGAAAVNGGMTDVADAWQSNPNRVFFRYTQLNDQEAANEVPSERRLFTTGIEVTEGAGTAAPTASLLRGTVSAALVQYPGTSAGSGLHSGWGLGTDSGAQVVDRGTAAGDFLTFFRSNDNNVTDDGANGAFDEARLYVWDGTTTSLVSSDGATDLNQQVGLPHLEWTGRRVHVIWQEYAGAATNELALMARSFQASDTQVAAIPALGSAPAQLDLLGSGVLGNFQVAASGSTVGVFLEENGRVYYNETRSDAAHYRTAGGSPDPTLVDHDSRVEVESWNLFRDDGSSPLSDSFLIYSKGLYNNNDFVPRLFVRVHD